LNRKKTITVVICSLPITLTAQTKISLPTVVNNAVAAAAAAAADDDDDV